MSNWLKLYSWYGSMATMWTKLRHLKLLKSTQINVNEKRATDAQGILTSQQLIQLITALPYLYANINHAVIVPAKTSSKNMK